MLPTQPEVFCLQFGNIVWTSEGRLQASSVKYVKGILCNLGSHFYSFIKCMLLCQINYVQEKVKMV
jgi:hypothetical protein